MSFVNYLYKNNKKTIIYIVYSIFMLTVAHGLFFDLSTHLLDAHDDQTFADNLHIEADFSYFFSSDKSQTSGRPTAELFKFALFYLYGNDPAYFHLATVALHLLASLLLARFIFYIHEDGPLALLAALLFLIGVSHFQAIHHISALDYPLALILTLLAALNFARFLSTRAPLALLSYVFFLVLAAATHPSTLFLIPLCLYWGHNRGLSLRGPWLWYLLAAAAMLPVALLLTAHTTTTWAAIENRMAQSFFAATIDMLELYVWFAGRLLTTAHWLPLKVYALESWEIYPGLLVVAALVWLTIDHRRSTGLWGAWVLLSLAPFALMTRDVIFMHPSGTSRYLYIASAGSALLLAWGILALSRRLETLRPRLGITCATVLVVALTLSSFVGLKRAEALSLYSSARSHISRGDLEGGVYSLRKALDQPHTEALPLADVYFLLCTSMPYLGEDPTPYLERADAIAPDHKGLQATRAIIERQSADLHTRKRGEQRLRTAIERAQQSSDYEVFARNLAAIYHNVGMGLAQRGNYPAAIHALTSALTIDATKVNSRSALCKATQYWAEDLEAAGRSAQALFLYRQLLAIDPSSTKARAQIALLAPELSEESAAHTPDPLKAYAMLYQFTDIDELFSSNPSPGN